MAGKSTLNRLELSRAAPTKYRKIAHDPAAIEGLFVDLFIEAHAKAPKQITLDLDATDDPVHGDQEGRFFNGYYDCYCYLPLYVFCGRHLLAAKLRPSNVDGAAAQAEAELRQTGKPARRFKDFKYATLKTWSRRRLVVGKAEWTNGEANPRFVVTTLKFDEQPTRELYENVYCARGDMENRIKELQADLFADRTSTATMMANQLDGSKNLALRSIRC